MLSIRSQQQVVHPRRSSNRQNSIKMGKKRTIPGFFPFQGIPQDVRIDGQQQESLLPCPVFGGTFDYLFRC